MQRSTRIRGNDVPLAAEVLALKTTMEVTIELNLKHMKFESDNLTLTKMMNDEHHTTQNEYGMIVNSMKKMKRRFMEVSL